MSEETNTVRLSYKNYEFEVTVDLETYKRINSDEAYKEDFAHQTYVSLENDGHFLADAETEEKEDVKPLASLFKWTKPAIDQLINIRFSRNDEFTQPKTRKSELWYSVARALSHTFPGVTGEMCDAKYRNLLHTYKLNKQKKNKYGLDSVKWEYFDIFDNTIGLKMSSQREATFFDSFLDDDEPFTKEDLLLLDMSRPDSPDLGSGQRQGRFGNKEMTIGQYLRLKAESDIRNMKMKARIWKEKKQLKEREIGAIIQLAKALKNRKN